MTGRQRSRVLRCAALLSLLATACAEAPDRFRFGFRASDRMQAPLEVRFTSTIPAGHRAEWDFGDGSGSGETQPTHVYYRPGDYTVKIRLLDGRGRVVGQGSVPLAVKTSGPEHANLTLLLVPGAVRLSSAGSVVYRNSSPRFWLDGREVDALDGLTASLRLTPGQHRATLRLQGSGGPLEKTVTFEMAKVQTSGPFDAEVLRLTNAARASGWNCQTKRKGGPALRPLQDHAGLSKAAAAQSVGMALGGYFDHRSGLDGSRPAQRLAALNLSPHASAENIASGHRTPAEVVSGWLHSPGHCENIMGDFTHLGVSFVSRPETAQKTYWTQVFAKF